MDEIWERIHSEREWGKYPSEIVIRFIARNYYGSPERSKVKILDFGCGAGANTWYMAREGFDVYAFDGSSSAVKRVEKYLEAERLNAKLSVQDGINIQYPDDFFDAVVDNVCIYANPYDKICIMYQNVFRVLKPGGKMFTAVFGKKTTGYGLGKMLEKDTFTEITDGPLSDRGISHFYDMDSFKTVLTKNGFSDLDVNTMTYSDVGSTIEILFAVASKNG